MILFTNGAQLNLRVMRSKLKHAIYQQADAFATDEIADKENSGMALITGLGQRKKGFNLYSAVDHLDFIERITILPGAESRRPG